jgi:hypothetical protein
MSRRGGSLMARTSTRQKSGGWRNSTPHAIHVPGGKMGYPAFSVRDAVTRLRRRLTEPSQFDRSEAGISFVFNKGTAKVSTTF